LPLIDSSIFIIFEMPIIHWSLIPELHLSYFLTIIFKYLWLAIVLSFIVLTSWRTKCNQQSRYQTECCSKRNVGSDNTAHNVRGKHVFSAKGLYLRWVRSLVVALGYYVILGCETNFWSGGVIKPSPSIGNHGQTIGCYLKRADSEMRFSWFLKVALPVFSKMDGLC